jgi:hypothetical protein
MRAATLLEMNFPFARVEGRNDWTPSPKTRLGDAFLGFRNDSGNRLRNPIQNFWTRFIPETGISLWHSKKKPKVLRE